MNATVPTTLQAHQPSQPSLDPPRAVDGPRRWLPWRVLTLLGLIVFWSWNALLLALVGFGIAPLVMFEAVRDAGRGLLSWELVATGGLLIALPVVSLVFAVRRLQLRGDRMLALFYGLEAPLGLLCLARLFLVRELNPGLTHFLAAFFLGAAALAVELGGVPVRARWARHAQLAAHAVGLLVCAYLSVLVTFYVLPIGASLLMRLLSLGWLSELNRMLWRGDGAIFFIVMFGLPGMFLTAGLFVVTPLALPVLHYRALARVVRAHRAALGRWVIAPCAAAVVATVALFPLANRQPQEAAFAALAAPPATAVDRARLLDGQDEVRAGLLNAYLGPYRYFGARGAAHDLAQLYHDELGLSPAAAARVQAVFTALAAPAFYDGASAPEDAARAEGLYRAYFDAPLQKREAPAIVHALTTTYSSAEREAGFLDRGQERVRLTRQEVTVAERGAAAEIEIHDRWENQTYQPQEVVLVFTLPEEAAVTGLWLGMGDDRSQRFAAQVSPRGAAQAVYRNEVSRRVDPALLEQIGPRQYRLRAYPVPPRPHGLGDTPALHVWLTYVALPEDGAWPMPRLAERRNAYWDGGTERVLAQAAAGAGPGDDGRSGRGCDACWVTAGAHASPAALAAAQRPALEIALPDGTRVQRTARRGDGERWAAGRRLAVVVDRSLSMAAHAGALRAELDAVGQLAARNQVDVLLAAAAVRGEGPRLLRSAGASAIAGADVTAFGGASLAETLSQTDAALRDEAPRYDAVLVLTDDGAADLARDRAGAVAAAAVGPGEPPLWLVHVGGAFSPGYDDRVLARLERSRGGVAGSVREALDRQAVLAEPDVLSVAGGAVWTRAEPASAGASSSSAVAAEASPQPGRVLLQQLAARQLLVARARGVIAGGAELAALDEMHALAVDQRVVSPYSSMIVLVEQRQLEALALAEKGGDRFARTTEPEAQALTQPSSPFAMAATPEPHEWILIGLGAAALLAAARRRPRWRSPA